MKSTIVMRVLSVAASLLPTSRTQAAGIEEFEAPQFSVGALGTGDGLKTQSMLWSLFSVGMNPDLLKQTQVQKEIVRSGSQALVVNSVFAGGFQSGFSTCRENSARRIKISADVLLGDTDRKSTWQFIAGDMSVANGAGGIVGGFEIHPDGTLRPVSNVDRKTNVVIPRDVWRNYSLVFDLDSQSFNLLVDGKIVMDKVPMRASAEKVRIFQFSTFANGSDKAYFDNFIFAFPGVDGPGSTVGVADDSSRAWTHAPTGRTITGTIVGKTPDGSRVTVKRKDTGKEVELVVSNLSEDDPKHISGWSPPKVEPKGIVRGRVSTLSQAQGGKSRVMGDLQSVLRPYGKPIEDTAPNPKAFIYKGPALYPGGPKIEIPYLMPFGKALSLLVQRPGPASRRPAVAPGFPPGMVVYEYDLNPRFGVYNRMFVVVDQADQMVALQIKSETKNDPNVPSLPDWKPAVMPNRSTSDFIEPKTGGAVCHVLDIRGKEKCIVIDLEAGGETLLFLPEPMINLCLFHLEEDLRK